MKHVYRLRVILVGTVVVDMLYWNEEDAENHADAYRESETHYKVKVTREEVR